MPSRHDAFDGIHGEAISLPTYSSFNSPIRVFRYTIHGKPPGRLPHSTPTIELYISRHRQRNGQLRPWYLRTCAWIPVPFESARTRTAGSASRPYTAEGGCIASLFLFVTKSLNLNIMHPFWQLMGLNNGMCNNETICGIFKRFS